MLGPILGLALLGNAHERPCPDLTVCKGYHGLLTNWEFLGVLLTIWLTPALFLAVGVLTLQLLLNRHPMPSSASASRQWALGGLGLASVGVALFCWTALIKPWIYQNAPKHVFGPDPGEGNALSQFLGAGGFVASAAVLAAVSIHLFQLCRHGAAQAHGGLDYDPLIKADASLLGTDVAAAPSNVPSYLGLAAVLGVSFVATWCFSPVWVSPNDQYWPSDAPESLFVGQAWARFGPPEAPTFIFKLYSDVVIYYAFLGGLAAAAALTHSWGAFRRCMHRRVNVSLGGPGRGQWIANWPLLASWGDLFPHGAR